MKAIIIAPETHPNLLSLTNPIIVEDLDAGGEINVTELIIAARAELGGAL